jgi:hypothetical protein
VGLFREDGTPQPVLKLVDSWEGKLLALLREHGGTPMAQAQLARELAQVKAAAWDLSGLQAAGRAAALEASTPKAIEPPSMDGDDGHDRST